MYFQNNKQYVPYVNPTYSNNFANYVVQKPTGYEQTCNPNFNYCPNGCPSNDYLVNNNTYQPQEQLSNTYAYGNGTSYQTTQTSPYYYLVPPNNYSSPNYYSYPNYQPSSYTGGTNLVSGSYTPIQNQISPVNQTNQPVVNKMPSPPPEKPVFDGDLGNKEIAKRSQNSFDLVSEIKELMEIIKAQNNIIKTFNNNNKK